MSLFINTLPTNAKENTPIITEQDKGVLKNLGFTEEEIYQMDQEEYSLNINLEGNVMSEETKYFKVIASIDDLDMSSVESIGNDQNTSGKNFESATVIELDKATYWKEVEEKTLEEKNNNVDYKVDSLATNQQGQHKTSYKTMTTTIVKLSTNNFRVKTNVAWHKAPSNRKIDLIATAINSAHWSPVINSQYGKQSWTIRNRCPVKKTSHSATYNASSNKWKKGASGYGLLIDLPNNYNSSNGCNIKEVSTLSSYAYYTVNKLTSVKVLDAYGKYSHQETNIQIAPTITFGPASIGVSASFQSKFTNSSTHAKYKW